MMSLWNKNIATIILIAIEKLTIVSCNPQLHAYEPKITKNLSGLSFLGSNWINNILATSNPMKV